MKRKATRHRKTNKTASSQRQLFCEALEPRVLFSAAPVPVDEAPPEAVDIPVAVQEAAVGNEGVTPETAAEAAALPPEIGSRSSEVPEAARVGAAETIKFQFDYRFDTSGFFNVQERRDALEAAGNALSRWLIDDLDAIVPNLAAGESWSITFSNPSTDAPVAIQNVSIAADTLLVFVGARPLSGGAIGIGGPGGYSASGSQEFFDRIDRRGQGETQGTGAVDFAPWGGALTFDPNANWYFSGQPTSFDQTDFYSTAVHELGHLLGIGTSQSWNNLSRTGVFTGAASVAAFGGNVPLTPDLAHWQNGLMSPVANSGTNQEPIFDPEIFGNARLELTRLDLAGLDDLGWELAAFNVPPVIPPIADRVIPWTQTSLSVPFSVTDPDGQTPSLSVTLHSIVDTEAEAFRLDQANNFRLFPTGADYNARGFQEIYINSDNGGHFIVPSGDVFKWNGSIQTSQHVGTLDATYHGNITKMIDVASARPDMSPPVTLAVNGGSIDITKDINFSGKFTIRVAASDGEALTEQFFTVTVEDKPPIVTPIANQQVFSNQTISPISLSATDPDGNAVTSFSAEIVGLIDVDKTAFDLDQARNFSAFPGGEYFNARGSNEKYFQGNDGGYFIIPTGEIFKWNGSIATSTYVAKLDATYHANIKKLFDVPGFDADPMTPVTANVVGSTLTINKDPAFSGSFSVKVSANDGVLSSDTMFSVSVFNAIPTITPISDMSSPHSQTSVNVNVTAADNEGVMPTLSAEIINVIDFEKTAFDLDQAKNFSAFAGGDYFNSRGYGEKYFLGNDGGYFIIPTGEVFRWNGTIETSTYVALLGPSYHADVTKLFDIAALRPDPFPPATVSAAGNTVTVNKSLNFVGRITVKVLASDGVSTGEEIFNLSSVDTAPIFSPITDQTIPTSQDTVQVNLNAVDPEGLTLNYSAQAFAVDLNEYDAYVLDQTYDFRSFPGGNDFFNSRGSGEKYFQGTVGNQTAGFFILPTGEVFQWGGSIGTSTLVGTLSPAYHTDLTRLYNVLNPLQTPDNSVGTSFAGNQLTVDPPAIVRNYVVMVTANDGALTEQQAFKLRVTA